MISSRHFAQNKENSLGGAAFARTPGTSKAAPGSVRGKALTTGKHPAFGDKVPMGDEHASIGPKQLFKDLMQAKQTPRRNVLGEKTNKSPEKHHDDLPDGTSPQKGAGSPSKGTSSMRKNKSSAPTPFSGNQSYRTETDMGSVTPAPLRMLSRQSSFVTPAANIGRAGAIKARMGEMKDFEMGIGSGDPIGNVEAEQQGPQLTEEEMYPEIEYMPPSTYAHNPPYDFPAELDGLPRAREIGAQLAAFRPLGWYRGSSPPSSPPTTSSAFNADDAEFHKGLALAESDDDSADGLWPDVKGPPSSVASRAGTAKSSLASTAGRAGSAPKAPTSSATARRDLASSEPLSGLSASRAKPSSALAPTSSATRASTTVNRPSKTSASSTRTNTTATSRSGSVAASTTSVRSRPAASSSSTRPTSSLSRTGLRTGSNSVSPSTRPSSVVSRAASVTSSAPARRTPTNTSRMNPALRDLANDQLGQWAERRLAETQDDAEEGFALDDALDEHLTLEEASQDSEAERTPSGKARQGTEEADSAVVA